MEGGMRVRWRGRGGCHLCNSGTNFAEDITEGKKIDYEKEESKDRTLWNTRSNRRWLRSR